MTGIQFYWLLLGKNLSDGLRIIATDQNANVMVSVVHKVRNLLVYANHHGSMDSVTWDDIVVNPVNQLPKVLSPQKVLYEKNPAEKLPVFYTDVNKGRVDQAGPSQELDGDEEEEFVDSDYDIGDGDDDLLEDAVDLEVPEVKGNKKAKGSQLKGMFFFLSNKTQWNVKPVPALLCPKTARRRGRTPCRPRGLPAGS